MSSIVSLVPTQLAVSTVQCDEKIIIYMGNYYLQALSHNSDTTRRVYRAVRRENYYLHGKLLFTGIVS